MKITGKLIQVTDVQQISNTFKKRSFVIEYIENPQYPEYISFDLIQDRCSIIESFKIDNEIEVSFNLKGRKWINPEGFKKYFNSLHAWKIEMISNKYQKNTENTFKSESESESGPGPGPQFKSQSKHGLESESLNTEELPF